MRTDHGSLRWMFSFKDPQGQLSCWMEILSQYTFDIHFVQHRPGTKHQNADSLSRKDGESPLCEHKNIGQINHDCSDCEMIIEEWSDFKKSVDDVENFSQSIRVVTRCQTKKYNNSNWLDGYTNKEI